MELVQEDGNSYSIYVKGYEIWIPDNDADGLFMEISKGSRSVDFAIDEDVREITADGHKLILPTEV